MSIEQLSLLPEPAIEHLYVRLYRRLDPVLLRLGYGYVYTRDDARISFAGLERRLAAALDELQALRAKAGAA